MADAATVAGCCVGAGFLSGKEAALYYGNNLSVFVFVAVFCVLTFVVRRFALKNRSQDVSALCKACYPKMGTALATMTSFCCFVCVVAILAGAERCLSALLLPNFDAFYGLIVGLFGVLVVKSGLHALKVLNVISLAVAGVYVVWLAVEVKGGNFAPIDTPLYAPLVYATFSVTMALGVVSKLAQTDTKSNIVATVASGVLLVALALSVLHLCDFNLELPLLKRTQNTALNAVGGVAIILCTITGVSCNAMPVVDCIKDVFDGDVTLCLLCVFAVATAFSLLGVDIVMKYGYLIIAGVGLIIVCGCLIKGKPNKHTIRKRKKI